MRFPVVVRCALDSALFTNWLLVLVGAELGVHADRFLAELALEALLVPLSLQGGNGLLGDGLLAAAALGRVQTLVVGGAVRLAVTLEERLAGQLLFARPAADEVLQVPGLAHRFDHFLGDHLPAGGTDRLELGLVALGANGLAVVLVELVLGDTLPALLASKVLRVPGLVQRLQHLVLDLLLAAVAGGHFVKFSSLVTKKPQ